MVVLPSRGLFPCICIRPFLADELLQFSFSDEGLNLLFQIVAICGIMTVVTVETAILISRSLGWIALQLPWKVRDPSSLICISTWSSGAFRGVKLVNLPLGGLERFSSRLSPVLDFFPPWSYRASSSLSLFLGLSSLADSASSAFMYFVAL